MCQLLEQQAAQGWGCSQEAEETIACCALPPANSAKGTWSVLRTPSKLRLPVASRPAVSRSGSRVSASGSRRSLRLQDSVDLDRKVSLGSRADSSLSSGSSNSNEQADLPYTSLPGELAAADAFGLLRGLQRRVAHLPGGEGRWLLALSDELLTELALASAVAGFEAGEPLLCVGEAPTFIGLILQGSVGEEVGGDASLVLRSAGDLLGAEGLFSAEARPSDVVGVEPGVICLIGNADLDRMSGTFAGCNATKSALASAITAAAVDSAARGSVSSSKAGCEEEDGLLARFRALSWEMRGRSLPLEAFCCGVLQRPLSSTFDSTWDDGRSRGGGSSPRGTAGAVPSQVPPATAVQLLHRLRDSPWAHGALSLANVAALSDACAIVRFTPGDVILREGQPASFVCLVLEGLLDVGEPGSATGRGGQPGEPGSHRVGAGEAIGFSQLFAGGARRSDATGASVGYVAVISYAAFGKRGPAEPSPPSDGAARTSTAAAQLLARLASLACSLDQSPGSLPEGELSSDLVKGCLNDVPPAEAAVEAMLDACYRLDWPTRAELAVATEALCERAQQHASRSYTAQLPLHFAVRVVPSHGSSLLVTLSLTHTVADAIVLMRRRLLGRSAAGLSGNSSADTEWVLQVAVSGEVLRGSKSSAGPGQGDESELPLSQVTTVREHLQYRRAPVLRLCRLSEATLPRAVDAEESGSAAAVHELLGPPLAWSSESAEPIAFRLAMRALRPTEAAAHSAAAVWRHLPTFRCESQNASWLPEQFTATVRLSDEMTKKLHVEAATTVDALRAKALAAYAKATLDDSRPAHLMCLKVVGCDEYLDGGIVVSYEYVRRCLRKGAEVALSLVPNPLASLPPLSSVPPQPPQPALASGPPSRSLSLYDLPDHLKLRVEIISAERLRSVLAAAYSRPRRGGACSGVWALSVRLGVYHGGVPLCDPVETPAAICDEGSNPSWSASLQTSLPLHHIPRAARVCFTLCARPAGGRAARDDEGAATSSLGWVSMMLVGHDERLANGTHALRLWPEESANPIGCNLENATFDPSQPEPPVLFVAFDRFAVPVVMPPDEEFDSASAPEPPPPMPPRARRPGSLAAGALPSTQEVLRLKRIIEQDPLSPLSLDEKELVWRHREFVSSSPEALSKLLESCKWDDRTAVAEAHALLQKWAVPSPTQALKLLDAKFADPQVRAYAVERLGEMSDTALAELVLQLTQVLKYESRHDSALARLLLRRALRCPHQVGHRFFWALKAEMHLPEVSERFGLLLQEYLRCCGPHREKLLLQSRVEQSLIAIARAVQREKKSERIALLRQKLSETELPPRFQLPLDPRIECTGLVVSKCRCMDSKKVPLWLVFSNADPQGTDVTVMFKCGDDLRQDALTMQLIRSMERKWEAEDLDLRLSPYGVVATGDEVGFIEIVLNSNTTANITKEYGGGASGAFAKEPMAHYLREHNKSEREYAAAVETFAHSLAGYCVATYVLGIGDRHNDNVMLSKNGHLFHIDFGATPHTLPHAWSHLSPHAPRCCQLLLLHPDA